MRLKPSKNIFIILGVARSGTSVIARTLKTLGIHLGNKLTQPGKWNPTGFWEDNDVVYQINQRLFDKTNFRWDSVKLFDHSTLLKQTRIANSALKIIQQRYQQQTDWGFKDPRTVRILPFWQLIFSRLQLNEHYIIVLRNPLCSAQSFANLGKNDIEKGLLLWLMHLYPAIEETHDKKRIVVSYENMIQNPRYELARLQKYFNLPPINAEELQQFTEEFLNKNLEHYPHTYSDLATHPATKITPLILQLYDCLLQLAQDDMTFDDKRFMTIWADIKTEFKSRYATYCYIDKLLIANNQLKKSLRSVQRSPSWKIIFPLRMLEKFLSSLRKWFKLQFARKTLISKNN